MTRNIKTSEALTLYGLVKTSKVSKVESAIAKYAIIKAIRPLKKISEEFETWREDAVNAIKGEEHDLMIMKAQQWQKQEQEGRVELSMEERAAINRYFEKFNRDIASCINPELEKENAIETEMVDEKSFSEYIASNDWSVEQIMLIEEYMR